MPTFTSRVLLLALFILINAPDISARGGKGEGSGSSSSSFSFLNLDPMEAAVFALYIIFAVSTVSQVFKALSALRKRLPDEDYPRRIPYILLILLVILTLITTYSLGAVIQLQTNNLNITLTSVDWRTVLAMLGFTRTLAHVFLYAGLLLLLDYRSTIQALQYGRERSKQFVIALRCVVYSFSSCWSVRLPASSSVQRTLLRGTSESHSLLRYERTLLCTICSLRPMLLPRF
jgi:amino acid transporter